jgi:hypothetical protein
MTRVHVRLLGPCFKTGQMGGRLQPREPSIAHNHSQAIQTEALKRTPESTTCFKLLKHRHGVTAVITHQQPKARHHRSGQHHTTTSRTTVAPRAHLCSEHRSTSPSSNVTRTSPWASAEQMMIAGLHQLQLFPPQWFHVLLNSLFKVLCNFPSRYLFAIGLVSVFSLR